MNRSNPFLMSAAYLLILGERSEGNEINTGNLRTQLLVLGLNQDDIEALESIAKNEPQELAHAGTLSAAAHTMEVAYRSGREIIAYMKKPKGDSR